MNKWIMDKNPKNNEMILILCQDRHGCRDVVVGSYDANHNFYYEHRKFIDLFGEEDEWVKIPDIVVVAWMPLPSTEL